MESPRGDKTTQNGELRNHRPCYFWYKEANRMQFLRMAVDFKIHTNVSEFQQHLETILRWKSGLQIVYITPDEQTLTIDKMSQLRPGQHYVVVPMRSTWNITAPGFMLSEERDSIIDNMNSRKALKDLLLTHTDKHITLSSLFDDQGNPSDHYYIFFPKTQKK